MTDRVYNFTAGPATLPLPVMNRIQEEFRDFKGMGAGVIEISHRSTEFGELLDETSTLLRDLMDIPEDYELVYAHGGGQMEFAMVALNFLGLKPAKLGLYVDSGSFAHRAAAECARYGTSRTIASSQSTLYDTIPELEPGSVDAQASYLHITTNNTALGTRWQSFPRDLPIPLVGDATSEILSRPIDVTLFGCLYAGAQKNLAPSGLSVAIIRPDMLDHALPFTPLLLDFTRLAGEKSLINTVNTFSIYVMNLMLHWLGEMGGVAAIERLNEKKAKILFDVLDQSDFYIAHAKPAHRGTMNVVFTLPEQALLRRFIEESAAAGLYGLGGHPMMGGVRASIYNAMPLEGAQSLADFMVKFEKSHG